MIVLHDGILLESRKSGQRPQTHYDNSGRLHIYPTYTESDFCQGINEPISPSKSVKLTLWASAEYDMTEPGTYEITVTRETDPWSPDRSVTVKSNIINIIVPEPEAPEPK